MADRDYYRQRQGRNRDYENRERDWDSERDWDRGMNRGFYNRGYNQDWDYERDWNRDVYPSGYYTRDYDWGQDDDRGGYDRDWGRGYSQDWDETTGWQTTPSWYSAEYWWQVPGPYAGIGPRGYRRSDERILDDIHDRLTRHGQIDASDINVRIQDGEVTLTGTANSRREKRIAEDIAESVSGVWDVHNQLRIQGGMQRGGMQRGMDRQNQIREADEQGWEQPDIIETPELKEK